MPPVQDCAPLADLEPIDVNLTVPNVTITAVTLTSGGQSMPAFRATWPAITDPYVTEVEIQWAKANSIPAGQEAPSVFTPKAQLATELKGGVLVNQQYAFRWRSVGLEDRKSEWSATYLVTANGSDSSSSSSGIVGQGPWATEQTPVDAVVVPGANLVYNPEARLGTQGWTVTGGWAAAQIRGAKFWQLTTAPAATMKQTVAQAIDATQKYTLSAAIDATGVTVGQARVLANWKNGGGAILGTSTLAVAAGTYDRVATLANITPPVGSVAAEIEITNAGATTYTYIRVTKVKLEQGTVRTVFTDNQTHGAMYDDGTSMQGLKPGEAGADVTLTHTANAITGQGALATRNTVGYAQYAIKSELSSLLGDPTFEDTERWAAPSHAPTGVIPGIKTLAAGDGYSSPRVFYTSLYTGQLLYRNHKFPIDPKKEYQIEVVCRRLGGDQSIYVGFEFYDSTGAGISGAGSTGWQNISGNNHYLVSQFSPTSTAWQVLAYDMGPTGVAFERGSIPANAASIGLVFYINSPGSGTLGEWQFNSIRLAEKTSLIRIENSREIRNNAVGVNAKGAFFDFNGITQNWNGTDGTLSAGTTALTWVPGASGSPRITSPTLAIDGSKNRYVWIRAKALTAIAVWDGKLRYGTSAAGSNHGHSASFQKLMAQPTLEVGESITFEYDMWSLDAGGTDWQTNTIVSLQWYPTGISGNQWEIDWIGVGSKAQDAVGLGLAGDGTLLQRVKPSKMPFAAGQNLFPDPQMADATMYSGSTFTLRAAAVDAGPSTNELVIASNAAVQDVYSAAFPVEEGRTYTASVFTEWTGSIIGVYAFVAWYSDVAGTTLISESTIYNGASTAAPTQRKADVVAPATARRAKFHFQRQAGVAGSAVWSAPHIAAINERVVSGFDANGDLARNITVTRANSSDLLRYAGGNLFTGEMAADVTLTHTAAAIVSQGALATANSAAWGTQVSGRPTALTDLDANNRLKSGNLAYADLSTVESLKPAEAGADITSTHTASAITGQGALATANSAAWATQVSGRPTALTDLDSNSRLKAANLAYASLATMESLKPAEAGADVTLTHTASAITGQGALATLNSAAWATQVSGRPTALTDLDSNSRLKSTNLAYADLSTLESKKPAEAGADVTATHTASAITGQGALATKNTAAWATDVSGRPTELTDGRIPAALDASGKLQTQLKATVTKTTDPVNMILDVGILDAGYWTLGAGFSIETADTDVTGTGAGKLNLPAAFKTPTAGANGTSQFAEIVNTNNGQFYIEADQGATYLVSCRTSVEPGFKGLLSVGATWFKKDPITGALTSLGTQDVSGTDYRTVAAPAGSNTISDIKGVLRAPTIPASQTGTFTGQPAAAQTVTIAGKVYTFRANGTNMVGAPDGDVEIGANTAATLTNLINAINLTGAPGTGYSSIMLPNPSCTAAQGTGTSIVVSAKDWVVPSSITLAEGLSNFTWAANTLAVDNSILLARLRVGVTWGAGSAGYAFLAIPRMKEAFDVGVRSKARVLQGAAITDLNSTDYTAADSDDTKGTIFAALTVLATGKEVSTFINLMARTQTSSTLKQFKVVYHAYDAIQWAASGSGATPIASLSSRNFGIPVVTAGTFQTYTDWQVFSGLGFRWVTVVARLVPLSVGGQTALEIGIGSILEVEDDRTRST